MPTTCATATETREAPDRPQVFARTTQFLKKVSNFRTASRKGDSPSRPSGIARAAQSMDLSSKVETKLEVRPHSFDQSRDSGEDSPSHLSLRGSLNPNRASSSTTDSRIAPPLHQIDGLPRAAYSSQATTTTTTAPALIASHTRSQTLPSGTHNDVVDLPHNASVHSPSTIGPSGRRALAPRLATLPPPLMAQYTAGGSARLTPSWVTRQPPMPLLNLPTLPPPIAPHQPGRPSRPTAPLRSMPALPMQGPSDTEQDADHEDASVEDEEDDNNHAVAEGAGLEGDSDDSEDDSSIPSASSVAGPSNILALPEVDTSRFSISFRGSGLSCSPHASPRASPFVDYFTSKPPDVERIDHTPRPSDFRPNGKARALPELELEVPLPRIVSMPRIAPMPMPMFAPALSGSGAASHPNMYRHASKSMIDLALLNGKDKDKVFSPRLRRATPKIQDPVSMSTPATVTTTGAAVAVAAKEPDAAPAPEPLVYEPDDVIQSSTRSTLRRRRSLPVYKPSSDPPPYPDPWFRRRGQVVGLGMEEEGTEQLPDYSNLIHLVGVMPRKMEFTAPGMQARDRKWQRVYCVLEGTAFRVFKCPPAASRIGALEQWWERKVGAGDFTSTHASAVTALSVRVSAIREREPERLMGEEVGSERIPKIVEEPTQMRTLEPETQEEPRRQRERQRPARSPSTPPVTKSRLGLTSRFLHRQRSKSSSRTLSSISASVNESTGSSARLSMDSGGGGSEGSPHRSRSTTRDSMDIVESPRSSVASGLTIPAASPTSEPNERPSRRRSILSQSTLGSSSSGGSFPEQADRVKGKGKGRDCGGYMPDAKKDLLQQYSLQNAESGLASDYLKRKNVIRLRMEGQQFLLQAKDVGAVIDWIEGIQMGTNVALDIDDRPMPRGPIFPRRRRRRARRPEPESAGAGGGSIASAGS